MNNLFFYILIICFFPSIGQKTPDKHAPSIEINQDFMRGAIGYEISMDDSYIVAWAKSNLLKIYSAKNGKLFKTLRDHHSFILAANFNPVTGNLFSLDMNGNLIEWDSSFSIKNRQLVKKHKTTYQTYVDCLGMGQVGILFFSIDGKNVYYSHRDFDYGTFDDEEYEKQKNILHTADSLKLNAVLNKAAHKEIIFDIDEYYNIYRAFLDKEFTHKYFLYEKYNTYPSLESKLLWKDAKLVGVSKEWTNTTIMRGSNYNHRWDDFAAIEIKGLAKDSTFIQCFEEEPFAYMSYSISKPIMVLRNNDLLTVIDLKTFRIKSKRVLEIDADRPTPLIDTSGTAIEFWEPDPSSPKSILDKFTYSYSKYNQKVWNYWKDSIYNRSSSVFLYYPTLHEKMVTNEEIKWSDETEFANSCKKNQLIAKYLEEGNQIDVNHIGAVTGTPLMEYKEEGKHIQLISKTELISPCTDGSLALISYPGLKTLKKFRSMGATVQTGFIPNTNLIFIQNSDGTIFFFNKNQKNETGPCVSLNSTSKGLIFLTDENYYMIHGKLTDYLFFNIGTTNYPFQQFDLKFNRPDKVLQKLGCKDSVLISSYNKAYLKRIKKMNFNEEMLRDDIHLPSAKILNLAKLSSFLDSVSITLNILASDSKYKLDRINIFINDVPIYGSNGINLRNENSQSLHKNISIQLSEGQNKIQVSVLNQAGAESYKETVYITYKPKQPKKPDLYLVTIGDSKYKDARFNLSYASKDAEDIKTAFANNASYANTFTYTYTNEKVTKENILALKKELLKAKRDDVVIITVAGHGVLDKNLDYYLATYDMDFNNPSGKGIPYEELESLVDGIAPLKKVLFLDACHSGEVDKDEVEQLAMQTTNTGDVKFRAAGAGIQKKNLGLKTTSELMGELFTDLRRGTGATVISSAGGAEYAMESDQWKNGLFTYCLLHGLKDKAADANGDGQIMLSELQQYLRTEVTKLSNGAQQPTSRIENLSMDFRVW